MKNKILPIFFLASFLISGCLSANAVNMHLGGRFISSFYSPSSLNGDNLQKEMKTRKIQVVDSVEAHLLMIGKVTKMNRTNEDKMMTLEDNLSSLEKTKAEYHKSLIHVYELDGYSSQPKNKNSYEVGLIMDYLPGLLDRVPDSEVLSYCKEKDVEKARKSAMPTIELKKLVSKFKEKVLKNSKKGDFSSGFVRSALNWEYQEISGKLNALVKENKQIEDEIENLMNQRVHVSKNFDSAEWSKLMGETPIPTKTEDVHVPDFTGLTYDQMVNKYYNTPDLRKALKENLTVEGRFDGQNLDRITVFPLESSRVPNDKYEPDEWKKYKRVILMSQNETVPPMIIQNPEQYGCFMFDEYLLNIDFRKILNLHWFENQDRRDGILISYSPFESTIAMDYTVVFNDGRWQNITPQDAEYMTFQDCEKRFNETQRKSQILTLNAKDNGEGIVEYKNVKVLPFKNRNLHLGREDDDYVYFKTDKHIADLKVPAKNQIGYTVLKDYWGKNDDALSVFYKDPDGNQTCNIYRLEWMGPDGYFLNDTEFDVQANWIKHAEGVYNPNTDKYRINNVEPVYETDY